MCQPASNPPKAGWLWAADNGCFSDGWDEDRWLFWLQKRHPRAGCLFAVVPDVVADADATLERFWRFAPLVRGLRYPVAFVAQDGIERRVIPWGHFDCLFIGGSTEWKLSEAARYVATLARDHGKWVHVGRVNSDKRYRGLASMADSCDGTYIARGPTINTPKMERWLDHHDSSPQFDFPALAPPAPISENAKRG